MILGLIVFNSSGLYSQDYRSDYMMMTRIMTILIIRLIR